MHGLHGGSARSTSTRSTRRRCPVAWAGSSDRNFYDRCYFNAHDRTGDIFLITGLGYYPNLGTKDAFVLVRRGDKQTAVHLCDADRRRPARTSTSAATGSRSSSRCASCGSCSRRPRASPLDLTWEGSFDVVQEQPHVMRAGRAGHPRRPAVRPGRHLGGHDRRRRRGDRGRPATAGSARRDRSWGIRPVGEAAPAGAPADPPFEGMWWLYVPMRVRRLRRRADHPGGARTASGPSTTAPGSGRTAGSSSSAGRGSRSATPRAPGCPTGATITCTTPDGKPRACSRSSRSSPCRSTSAAATAATPTGPTACGRAPAFTERRHLRPDRPRRSPAG